MTENKTTEGLFWRSLESIGVHGMQAAVQLVLARLLLPEDFGIVALLNIFVSLANTLIQNGLGTGLLRKKDRSHRDYSTVFFVEFGASLLLYAVIFFSAPQIASFYGNPALTVYLRAFALTVVFSSISAIQTTLLRCKMDFKPSFIANFAGIIVQGAVGIGLAYAGFGVWSLILSQLAYRFVSMVLLTILAGFIPKLEFSAGTLKEIFSFSWKLLAGYLISSIYADVISLAIGKAYDEKTLGYYSKGITIPYILNRVVTQATTAVMLPAMTALRDDGEKLRDNTRGLISLSSALMLPVTAGIAAAAGPLIITLFTAKWEPSVHILQIMCISYAINVISNANMLSFNAAGRSDLFFICEAVKRTATVAVVIITAGISMDAVMWSVAGMGIVSLLINAVLNKKVLKYGFKDQLCDFLPYFAAAAVIFAAAYPINLSGLPQAAKLLLQIAVCAAIYLSLVFFVDKGAFAVIKKTIKDLLKKRASAAE